MIKFLRQHGWLVAHFTASLVPSKFSKTGFRWVTPATADGAGFPDIVAVRENICFIELKTDTGAVEPEQVKWLDKLLINTDEVYVLRPSCWEEKKERFV